MTLLAQKKLLQSATTLPWRPTLPMECVHKRSDISSRGLYNCVLCVCGESECMRVLLGSCVLCYSKMHTLLYICKIGISVFITSVECYHLA